jgi:hypothetical protein
MGKIVINNRIWSPFEVKVFLQKTLTSNALALGVFWSSTLTLENFGVQSFSFGRFLEFNINFGRFLVSNINFGNKKKHCVNKPSFLKK